MTLSVFISVTHLLGIGHLARAAAIGRHLAAKGLRVTLASGGMPAPVVAMTGITLLQLPPVRCRGTDFARLLDAEGEPIDPALRADRTRILGEAFVAAQPDVLITELFPFGRRGLADEALALLEAARARRPRPAVLCSVRDILNPPSKPSRAEETLERLGAHYDAVMVHGDPAVAPLAASWPVGAALARRLVPTGYIADRPATALPGPGDGTGEIVVSGGGSAASLPLYAAALGAAALEPGQRRWRVLVGQGVDTATFDSLVAKAPDHAIVERARRDFPAVLARAAVSISQAGYNTVVDLACAGVRAVVVPFEDGREQEQRLRADRFATLGLVQVVTEAELSAKSLAAAVDRAAAGPAPAGQIDLDGLAATATAIVHAADAAARRAAARARFEAALAALHGAGQTLRVWWRDDDATAPSPALDRLLALAADTGVPLALAVIPAGLDPALADRLAGADGVSAVQHGIAHANHAPPGEKKLELGNQPDDVILGALAQGRQRLEAVFGTHFVPMLVPPWNRIAPGLVARLTEAGFCAVSTFRRRPAALAAPGLAAVNTHLDPIAWRSGGGLLDPAALFDAGTSHIAAMLSGTVDPEEPFGLLTHHLVHDPWIWEWCRDVLHLLRESPAVRFVTVREAIAPSKV